MSVFVRVVLFITVLAAVNALQFPKSAAKVKIRGGHGTPLEMSDNSSGLGWNSHQAIDKIPDSLTKTIEGNDSMRRKFEEACRFAQVSVV